jgi:hypothetical protein
MCRWQGGAKAAQSKKAYGDKSFFEMNQSAMETI